MESQDLSKKALRAHEFSAAGDALTKGNLQTIPQAKNYSICRFIGTSSYGQPYYATAQMANRVDHNNQIEIMKQVVGRVYGDRSLPGQQKDLR
ncbi:uncharacterized protein N7498_007888 [Penicillium cinerascens]|uniref:Uncharacterized protein n=1 Tax=Penicillium cinerascens TaxID=70096 RepID=A0A9W9JMH2_9EURO|nr:uncharacterized protein N7498_007888 [Penicillium cinerascens]KAJ5198771.1 hypothetical protein N7498_007888 [Penicillium cinerascens]